jgi:conjugal transfer pilus assembly protein TraK
MILSKRKLAHLPLLLAISAPATALQILDARDGETVLAKISQKEVTRIAFERSRIRKVTGNAGAFVLEKDEDKGQIFIRPVSAEATAPINIFVSSERSTVALLLQPVDTPSDTLLIREARDSRAPGPRIEQSARHVRTIKNLLLAMAGDHLPDDMVVREAGQELGLWPGVRLSLQRLWLGAGIVGEKYLLANSGDTALHLAERAFYKPGVMAVSVEHARLKPGESTNLFVIRERQAHD